jgi:hypothetical protein
MALRITRGHCFCHTLWSYFRPATRYVISLPATASAVALGSSKSALNISSVALTALGERLTCLRWFVIWARLRDSSRPMTPFAPRIVCIGYRSLPEQLPRLGTSYFVIDRDSLAECAPCYDFIFVDVRRRNVASVLCQNCVRYPLKSW